MTDKAEIKPALTPEEWERAVVELPTAGLSVVWSAFGINIKPTQRISDAYVCTVPELAKLIALANAILPDDDARKITRKFVQTIRDLTDADPCYYDHHGYCQAHGWLQEGECPHPRARRLTAAIESYLKPD